MTTQEKIMQDLLAITKKQSDNISTLSDAVGTLDGQMSTKSSKKASYGLSILIGLVTLLIVGGMFFKLQDTSNFIKDCSSISGNCHQQQLHDAASSNQVIVCNQEKIIVLFSYKLNESYKPFKECIPFIEQQLNIKIPADGIITPKTVAESKSTP